MYIITYAIFRGEKIIHNELSNIYIYFKICGKFRKMFMCIFALQKNKGPLPTYTRVLKKYKTNINKVEQLYLYRSNF